jgi:hypothetical protein
MAPAASVVFNVIHPGVRSTGAAVLSLFQNLFGLAVGPFVAGVLSDACGLKGALAIMPAFGLLAMVCFLFARRTYEAEVTAMSTGVQLDAASASAGAKTALSA